MAYLQIIPVGPLAPAALAALSDYARAVRTVHEARNIVIREAQLNGHQIPTETRATKYKSLVLRITEQLNKTAEWKAAALAELARQEANRAREGTRTRRVHNARVASKLSKRKTREAKKKKKVGALPSPPHTRAHPHSSDEAAEAAAAAVGGGASDDE